MENNKNIEKLKDLIKDIRIAMFSTCEADGTLRSRPMATNKMEDGGVLWFFTEKNSEKIEEIKGDEKVNISYMNRGDETYVSVSGNASVLFDKEKIKQLWNPFLKAWFPQGPEDPNIALLRVQITNAEYWDSPGSKMVQLIGMIKATVTGERYEPGENKKVRI